jgi:RNA methyltransferase, TrmH family
MPDRKPPGGGSLYRGPSAAPRDKRERERDRAREQGDERAVAPERAREAGPRHAPGRAVEVQHAPEAAPPRPPQEQRMYGLNACLALFAHRPQALRKVWLLESRIPALKPVLAFCVKNRLGYTIVEAEDLERLSGSAHHEGVVFGAMPAEELTLSNWLRDLPAGPQLAIWLDGVGNPHNFGAIARSAAHFGAAGILLPRESTLTLSGAAARVAEGGAEALPLVRLGRSDNAIAQLAAAGFTLAATTVRGGQSLYTTQLPSRLVLLMGAEQTGVDPALTQASTLKLLIPGTGAVESLNVASATSVLLSEWRRQQMQAPASRR